MKNSTVVAGVTALVVAVVILLASGSLFVRRERLRHDYAAVSVPPYAQKAAPSKWASVDPDVLDRAALEKVFPLLHVYASDMSTQAAIDKQRGQAACVRDWANHIADPVLKDAYLKWIDFYDGQLSVMETDLRNGRPSEDRETRADVEMRRRVRETARQLPTPEPCPVVSK